MSWREFLGTLSGAVAWPLAAHAQQPGQMRRIGMLPGLAEATPEAEVLAAARRIQGAA